MLRYLSVMDKTKCYYTLCRASSPIDTPSDTPKKEERGAEPKDSEDREDEGLGREDEVRGRKSMFDKQYYAYNNYSYRNNRG